MISSQLTLPIQLHDNLTFANFHTGNNQLLIDYLAAVASGTCAENYIYLYGAKGSGRSHLLQAVCLAAQENHISSFYLPLTQLSNLAPALLENLETINIICLDDIFVIAGNNTWEEAIFHLYNRCQMNNSRLIISGDSTPKELKIKLPDLLSRLSSGLSLEIQPLADDDKIAALQLKARNRGFELPTETANYLLLHLPRDLNSLFLFLDKLDQSSLIEKRKLTIPFVKKVLGI